MSVFEPCAPSCGTICAGCVPEDFDAPDTQPAPASGEGEALREAWQAIHDALTEAAPEGYDQAADVLAPLLDEARETVRRVEALAERGLRGFDMNPTLPTGGRDTMWWLGYLRRHENYWQSALSAALGGEQAGDGDG